MIKHSVLTGLKAGSLALVAGVAWSSVLDAGWGYRFFSGMGRPDEISGLTECQPRAISSSP